MATIRMQSASMSRQERSMPGWGRIKGDVGDYMYICIYVYMCIYIYFYRVYRVTVISRSKNDDHRLAAVVTMSILGLM